MCPLVTVKSWSVLTTVWFIRFSIFLYKSSYSEMNRVNPKVVSLRRYHNVIRYIIHLLARANMPSILEAVGAKEFIHVRLSIVLVVCCSKCLLHGDNVRYNAIKCNEFSSKWCSLFRRFKSTVFRSVFKTNFWIVCMDSFLAQRHFFWPQKEFLYSCTNSSGTSLLTALDAGHLSCLKLWFCLDSHTYQVFCSFPRIVLQRATWHRTDKYEKITGAVVSARYYWYSGQQHFCALAMYRMNGMFDPCTGSYSCQAN